jgi:hypothetical protein
MIKFLSGLNIQGNIDLNNNQIKEVVIDNLTADPTGVEGRIYYNTATNTLRLYANGSWADLAVAPDNNTTYDLSGVGSTNGTAGIRLTGSDATTDDVIITGSGTVTVTRTANTLTVTGTNSSVGTVTDVSGGTGITISGTSTITPTVNITTVGTTNAIEVLTAATPVGTDYVWFSDVDDANTLRKTLISNMPGFGQDGTVTNIASGAGLTGGPITATGTLAVDYTGADNVILTAADGTLVTVAASDKMIISDATDNNVKHVSISQLTSAIGGGTVTSVATAGTVSGLTLTGGTITTSGTITLGGTLSISSAQIISFLGYTPYDAANPSGYASGTVTSVGIAADNGAGTTITTTGGITLVGGTNISTNVVGQTITINATDQFSGTVTSVTAGLGLIGSGTSTINPTISVDYTATGVIADATSMSGYAESDDIILLGDDSLGGVVVQTALIDIPLNVLGTPTTDLSIDTHKLTNVVDPTLAQDAATKNYVDSTFAGSGSLTYQGGYNANTNVPNLDTPPTGTINKGFTYTVTADGTFFTEQVRVGDLLIANSNTPTTLANWTTVQNNIDLASTTVVGIASFSSDNFAVSAAGEVTVKDGGIILGTETTGSYNPTVGTNTNVVTTGVSVIDTLTLTNGVITASSIRTLPTSTETSTGVIELATQAEVDSGTGTNTAVTPATLNSHLNANSYSGTYPATSVATWTITAVVHGLGVGPKMIQTYDVNGNLVYLETSIAANGDVSFIATNAQAINAITCNIIKVR